MDKGALSEVLTRSAPVSYPKEKACNFITDTQRLLMSVMLSLGKSEVPEKAGFHESWCLRRPNLAIYHDPRKAN